MLYECSVCEQTNLAAEDVCRCWNHDNEPGVLCNGCAYNLLANNWWDETLETEDINEETQ